MFYLAWLLGVALICVLTIVYGIGLENRADHKELASTTRKDAAKTNHKTGY